MLYFDMTWEIEFHDEFEEEFDDIDEVVQDAIFARLVLLKRSDLIWGDRM